MKAKPLPLTAAARFDTAVAAVLASVADAEGRREETISQLMRLDQRETPAAPPSEQWLALEGAITGFRREWDAQASAPDAPHRSAPLVFGIYRPDAVDRGYCTVSMAGIFSLQLALSTDETYLLGTVWRPSGEIARFSESLERTTIAEVVSRALQTIGQEDTQAS